jgi:nucleoid-associated protein YgaU
MSSRYENANIVTNARKINSDGSVSTVRRLETTIYPTFSALHADDTYILSQEGDRMDNLAKEFYGDELFWHVIAKANGIGHGSLFVPPGLVIRIPYFDEYAPISAMISELNSRR